MNPQEALNILDQATAQLSATRQQHQVLQQAIATLRALVQQPSTQPPLATGS
jgi:hypothetical protein